MNTQDYSPVRFIERDTNLPSIIGTAKTEIGKKGATAEFYVGGERFVVDIDPVTGGYSWTPTIALPDGEYSVSLRIIDAAKNASKPSLYTLVIDTTPPEAPKLYNLYDNVGNETGSFDVGDTTDDKRPTLTGVAQKGAIVYLRDADGNDIGSAQADSVTGKWTMEPTQELQAGSNSLTLVAIESFAGKTREGVASQPFIINIQETSLPPNTITLVDALDDAGSITGSLSSGALTDDATPTLRGAVSAGETVTVFWRTAGSSSWTGSATATVSGEKWSWTPGTDLPLGKYEFQAGISSGSSDIFELDIADAASLQPAIAYAQDNEGDVQGQLASGDSTDDTTPTLHGRGESNSEFTLRYTAAGGTATEVTIKSSATGHWSWTPPALENGEWTFETQQSDGSWSSFTLTIDKDLDVTPGIDSVIDNVGDVTGSLNFGDTTDDKTPELHGTGAPNSTMNLRYSREGGNYIETNIVIRSDGSWSWQAPELADGKWLFEVKRNNLTEWLSSFELNVETVPPVVTSEVPVFVNIVDDQGDVKGNIAPKTDKGEQTDDTTPTFTGTAAANSIVYFQSAKEGASWADMGSAQVDGSGNWQFTPATLQQAQWQFRMMAKNSAGESGWSNKIWLNVAPDAIPGEYGYENFYGYRQGMVFGQKHTMGNHQVYSTISGDAAKAEERQLLIAEKSVITFEFPVGTIQKLSFDYHGLSADGTHIDFLDENGAIVDTQHLQTSDKDWFHFYNKLPDNKFFKSIVITTTEEPNDSGWFLDNLTWGKMAEATWPTFPFNPGGQNSPTSTLLYESDDQDESINESVVLLNKNEIKSIEISEILESGTQDLFITNSNTQMMIKGDEGKITLSDLFEGDDLGDWTHQSGQVIIAGEQYEVYTHTNTEAEILVQHGIQVELQNH